MSLQDITAPGPLYDATNQALDAFLRTRDPGPEVTSAERRVYFENRKLTEDMKKDLKVELAQSLNAGDAGITRLQREKGEWFKLTMGV